MGASVTDCGRERPDGEGNNGELGNGYVSLVDSLIAAAYPAHGLRVINGGVSANTTRDLAVRWQTDVLDKKPDWAAVLMPTNDVWRQFDKPRQTETHVLPVEYEANLHAMAQTRPAFSRPCFHGPVLFGTELRRTNASHDGHLRWDSTTTRYCPFSLAAPRSASFFTRCTNTPTGPTNTPTSFLKTYFVTILKTTQWATFCLT